MRLDAGILAEVKRIAAFWMPDVEVYAFGSRVHGRNLKRHSDLDLCVKGNDAVPERMLQKARDAFDVSDIPIRVDVVDWHRLAQGFREAIKGDLERII